MRRERIARGEGGNQFKKVKPRRVGMEGRREEEEGDANKSSLRAAICHFRIVGKSGLAEKEEEWKRGQPSIHTSPSILGRALASCNGNPHPPAIPDRTVSLPSPSPTP